MFIYAADTNGVWSGLHVSDNGNGSGFFSSAAISGGVYYAVYTLTNACGSDKDSVAITVEESPTAGFTYTIGGGGFTANFTNTTTGGAASYDWDFGGQGTSTQTNPSFTFSANGSYNVCLDAYSTTGVCINTFCQNITIVGVNENEMKLFSVYPNPSPQGNITVQFKQPVVGKMEVTDISGKTIFTQNIVPVNSTTLNLIGIDSGYYIVSLLTDTGKYSVPIQIIK